MDRYCYYIFKFIFYIFYKIFFRFETEGYESIPEEGGVIIAANHLSYLDPPLIGIAIKRRATYMAKSSLFKNPLISWFVRMFSIPVDRDRAKPSTIKTAVQALKEGKLLVIFPEGGRRRSAEIAEGRRGVGMLAALSRSPVVPAYIEGTDRALPVGARFIRPAKVRIRFGTPLRIESSEESKDFQRRVTNEIMNRIRELANADKGG
ncbi:MAG: 1-acyl-sn-glycerol-3-phosphate acyltransferase [Nitrospirae bacterium]|nr:MAG: 1-acyl-sn-glycerol-3-phosphate acyltransferase [Nitrospirota bacterium]